jgi:hypothetical protein
MTNDLVAALARSMGRDDLDACDPLSESEVGAQPPIESTTPPTPEAPATAADLRAAYRELYRATANAMNAASLLAQARVALKDAEAQVWPGSNETERKATMRAGTAIAREREQLAAIYTAETECDLALAKIRVDELRMLLRLAEYAQREDWREQRMMDAADLGF